MLSTSPRSACRGLLLHVRVDFSSRVSKMLRFVNICLVLGLVALAYVIYQVKYEARGLDAEIGSLGKQIERSGTRSPCCGPSGACSTGPSGSSGSPRNI